MRITTDFETGSGTCLPLAPDHWQIQTVADSYGYNKFFHFRLEPEPGEKPRMHTFEITADPVLQGDSHFMTHFPSMIWLTHRDKPRRWTTLQRCWTDSVQFHQDRVVLRFTPPVVRPTHVASNPPRPYSEHLAWMQDLAARSDGRLTIQNIGQSFDGRDIPVLRCGRRGKPRLLVVAGQHCSEHGGVWACEGMVEWLFSALSEAAPVLDSFDFAFVSMLNPDGNVRGLSGGTAQRLAINNSLDFGNAAEGTAPLYAENRALWNWMAAEFRPDICLHIHGYMGLQGQGDLPGDGVWVIPDQERYVTDPRRRLTQRAIHDRVLFQTPGHSGHFRHCGRIDPAFLDHELARAYQTIGLMYEINTGTVGPWEQFQRGPQLLRAIAAAVMIDAPLPNP
jgi:hypothetical protein